MLKVHTASFKNVNANFFAEKWQKSQKNVITTSTPDDFVKSYTILVFAKIKAELFL
jgi:hypothetical protein